MVAFPLFDDHATWPISVEARQPRKSKRGSPGDSVGAHALTVRLPRRMSGVQLSLGPPSFQMAEKRCHAQIAELLFFPSACDSINQALPSAKKAGRCGS